MKILLRLIALVLFSTATYAQSGAKIEFKTDTIDYGNITKETDNGVRVFEFTNTGDTDLIITDVKSTCACAVPTKPKGPIAPGKTGQIEVKYNMATGPIRKTITVHSNAVNVPGGVVALKLKGEVKK